VVDGGAEFLACLGSGLLSSLLVVAVNDHGTEYCGQEFRVVMVSNRCCSYRNDDDDRAGNA